MTSWILLAALLVMCGLGFYFDKRPPIQFWLGVGITIIIGWFIFMRGI
jgi:hypothetical protein